MSTNQPENEEWEEEDDFEENDDDDEEDEYQEALMNCGQVPGGGCTLVGTEYCDWECPFADELFTNKS